MSAKQNNRIDELIISLKNTYKISENIGKELKNLSGLMKVLLLCKNTTILGISRDSLKLHEKFKSDQQFPFELLSDIDEKVCQLYHVLKEKTMYGRKTFGIERSTFLIDKLGVLRHEWRKVKVPGHVEKVLQAVGELS